MGMSAEWFFNPAGYLVWVGLAIAITALAVAIMTLPTVAQMLFGRPRVALEFSEDILDGHKILECTITNAPVTGRMLRSGAARE